MDFEKILKKVGKLLSESLAEYSLGHVPTVQEKLTTMLDYLLEELIGSPSNPPTPHPAKFNPEKCLVDVANAVRHRPIAITERWKIIYFHTRICCVPMTCCVPDQIVLNTFTEKMARDGFTTVYWHQTKMNIISLYKELEQ